MGYISVWEGQINISHALILPILPITCLCPWKFHAQHEWDSVCVCVCVTLFLCPCFTPNKIACILLFYITYTNQGARPHGCLQWWKTIGGEPGGKSSRWLTSVMVHYRHQLDWSVDQSSGCYCYTHFLASQLHDYILGLNTNKKLWLSHHCLLCSWVYLLNIPLSLG